MRRARPIGPLRTACFCIGPQSGHILCPCMERFQDQEVLRDGRYQPVHEKPLRDCIKASPS